MPILMVPQLWIWKFEDHILSAYSPPGKNPEPLRESDINSRLDKDWRKKLKDMGIPTLLTYSDPDLHIGLLLAHHIDNFGEVQAKIFQSPLDIFETGVIQVITRVERFMKQPTSLKPDDIKKERGFMHDISDIRDELAMVDAILRKQESILNSVIENVNDRATENETWQTIVMAKQKLNTYRERVKKIDRDAERMEKNIQDQLNLKRTYSSIRDTHNGIILSTAVIGFTIVTVIFTPLAFMASLFALPIDNIVKHRSENMNYATNYIGKWFGKCAKRCTVLSKADRVEATAEIVSLAVTGLAVYASLLLLKIYGGRFDDDPKHDGKIAVSQDDGKTTGSISRSPKSLKLRRLWGRQKNGENVEDVER